MNFFKFDWFKSSERKRLQELKIENAQLQNSILRNKVQELEGPKPYKKIIYRDGNVTVLFPGGLTITKSSVDPSIVDSIRNSSTESEIRILLTPEKITEISKDAARAEEVKLIQDSLDSLRDNPDFEFKDKGVYYKGVNLPLPPEVLASFIEIQEKVSSINFDNELAFQEELEILKDQYTSLKKFWLKLATSPRKESRDQVLTFCKSNDIRLSKRGNIIGYRRVVKYDKDSQKVDEKLKTFVENESNKVKLWKKSAANYWVYLNEEGEYYTNRNEMDGFIGNLAELRDSFKNAPEKPVEQIYTSWHNKGMHTFKIGDVYKIGEDNINVDAGLCAAGGLHFAAVNYNYSSFGDTPVVVLVNPAKTITIPTYEISKGRTVEMKIACINPEEHGVHVDEALIEQADEEYDEYTIEELEETLRTKSFENLAIEDEVPALSLLDIKSIRNSLRNKIVNI